MIPLTFVELFAGCGGLGLGFEMDGWTPVYANEIDEHARASYRANHPGVDLVDPRDIHLVTSAEILARAHLRRGRLTAVIGGPPCPPFSPAGPRSQLWNGAVERLSFEFIRIVRGTEPSGFVMENVPGMARGVSSGIYNEVRREMEAAGYVVEAKILNACWFGV